MNRSLRLSVLSLTWLLLSGYGIVGQTLSDTLLLQEFELVSKRNGEDLVINKSTVDTLIRQQLSHLDLGELLASGTPIFVKSYGKGSLSTASIRGAGSSHTEVLWNGFSISSPMLGQVDLSQVPISFVDEVGVLFGGNSLLQSSGALGGSVILNNYPIQAGKPLLFFEQVLGSFHSYATALNLNFTSGKISSATRFIIQGSKNDFNYYNNGILPSEWMKQQNAAYRNTGFTQQFSYTPVRYHLISFITWNQWNDRDISPIMTNVQKGGKPEENQQDYFSRNILTWNYNKGETLFELKTAFFSEKQQYFLQTTTNGTDEEVVTRIDSKNLNKSFLTKTRFVQGFKHGFQLTAGANIGLNRVESSNYTETISRKTSAIYALLEKYLWERLNINFLFRVELADGNLLPAMPLLGFNYQLLKNKRLYVSASISKNYNLPTLNDLYWFPGGNDNLKAESGVELEGGLTFSDDFKNNGILSAGINGYFSWIDDWIQWTPSDYRYWIPENISEVYARGLETNLSLSQSFRNFNYKILAAYAFTRTTVESAVARTEGFSGTQLIYIPVHSANSMFSAYFKGFTVVWSSNFVGRRTTTLDPDKNYANSLEAYLLNNLSFGKSISFEKFGLNLRFKVNNLFNTDYQAIQWRPMPGRYYEFFITFKTKQ